MLKQLGTWFVVGLPLLIGIAPYAQEGKWAAQGDQSAQSLINMETERATQRPRKFRIQKTQNTRIASAVSVK